METLTITKPIENTGSTLKEIENLDFDRIRFKLLVKEDEKWSNEKIELAEKEYRRFLTLIKLNPEESIVPSKLMDEFWHMHILDTRAYREDCDSLFGRFIDHFPYFGIYGEEDRQNLISSFERTKELYYNQFGTHLIESNAARCEGKPCHVESKCKCRGRKK